MANRRRPPRLHSSLKSWMECCVLLSVRSSIIVRPLRRQHQTQVWSHLQAII